MGTIVGIIIGVAATVLVAQYYFRKTINKQISVFVTLSSRVFAGLEPQVRSKLEFHYSGKEITELQQIDMIIANNGDRAIRDCIEPLALHFKKKTTILDASIIHRDPSDLQVTIVPGERDNLPVVRCEFPLLNTGEFFLLKLLVDGYISRKDIECKILADDLPRSFSAKLLPMAAVTEPKRKVEWTGVILGSVFLLGVASGSLILWNYYNVKPGIWPFPWSNFQPTWIETPALVIGVLGLFLMALLGLFALIGMGFEEFFTRHPRFPLPEELRGRSYRIPRPSVLAGAQHEDNFEAEEAPK